MNILKISNKDFILKYDFRALIELQEYGISFTESTEYKLKDICKLLHVGLKKFQKEITLETVIDMMDDILSDYTLEELMTAVSKAMESSLGKQTAIPLKQ